MFIYIFANPHIRTRTRSRRGGKGFSSQQFDQEPNRFEDQGEPVETVALVLVIVCGILWLCGVSVTFQHITGVSVQLYICERGIKAGQHRNAFIYLLGHPHIRTRTRSRRSGKGFSSQQFGQEPNCFEDQGELCKTLALVLVIIGD